MDMKDRGLLWFQSQMPSIVSCVWMLGCMLDNKWLGMCGDYQVPPTQTGTQPGPASLQKSLREGCTDYPRDWGDAPKYSNSMLKAKGGQAEALIREPSRCRLPSPLPKISLWCLKPRKRWARTENKQEPYLNRATIFKAMGARSTTVQTPSPDIS